MLQLEHLSNLTILRHKPALSSVREIPLTRGLVVLVDADDYEELSQYRWRATSTKGRNTGYAARVEGKRTVLMHRQIMATPADMCTDHINGNGLDNRRANLRVCTNAENVRNRRLAKSNTSGFKGVGPFRGSFRADLATEYLGLFDTAEQAALAYDAAARERFGEFASVNFPDRFEPAPSPRIHGATDECRSLAVAMYLAGATLREAGRVAGVSGTAVQKWLIDAGVRRRPAGQPRVLTAAQAAEIKRRRIAGETFTSIAAEFGVSQPLVSRICAGQIWKDA